LVNRCINHKLGALEDNYQSEIENSEIENTVFIVVVFNEMYHVKYLVFNKMNINKNQLRENEVPVYKVTTLGEYCNLIDSVWSEWKREISNRQTRKQQPAHFYCGELSPWFRGLTTESYRLEPTFLRFFDEIHGADNQQNGFKGVQQRVSKTDMEKYFIERFRSLSSPIRYFQKFAFCWYCRFKLHAGFRWNSKRTWAKNKNR
jgi:hypothetical protein